MAGRLKEWPQKGATKRLSAEMVRRVGVPRRGDENGCPIRAVEEQKVYSPLESAESDVDI
jgi:hypothetical protein